MANCVNPSDIDDLKYAELYRVLIESHTLIVTVGVLIGIGLIITALIRTKRLSEPSHMMRYLSPIGTVFYYISGIMMISLSPFLEMLTTTFFNKTLETMCPFNAYITQPVDPIDQTIGLVYILLIIIGIISILRGLYLTIRLGEQNAGPDAGIGRIFAHIIGGICALNAETVWNMLSQLLQ